MLPCFCVVLLVQSVSPVHGPQAAQVGHPLPLQALEVGEVVLPERDFDTGEILRGVTVFFSPMLTEASLLP